MATQFTPSARIELNGRDVTTKWRSVLESVTVTDEAGIKADSCEFVFDNAEGFSAPPIGGEIRVWLGYEPQPVYMGRYKVDSWTKSGAPNRLSVSGKAADLTGSIKTHKMRSHHQTTVGAIVRKIAGEHGLTAVVDSRIASRKVEHIDQHTESDLGFLSRLAKRNGATFKLADGKIIFAAKGSKKLPGGGDKKAITIDGPSGLSSWTATCSERGGYKTASAHYLDHVAGKRKTARIGNGEPHHRDKRLYGSKEEAEAAAKANHGDLTRGKMAITLEMVGNPAMFAEALVTLKNFDPDVDGQYLVNSVTHTLANGGYRTSVRLESEGDSEPEE